MKAKDPMVPSSALGQWLVAQIRSEDAGDRYNYGACEAWYRCGLRFGVFFEEQDAEIKQVLNRHRQKAVSTTTTDSPLGFSGLR
jgi:hypothetical protein